MLSLSSAKELQQKWHERNKQTEKQFKLPSRKLPVEIKPTAIMATNTASSADYVSPSAASEILGIFLKMLSLGSRA